MLKFFTLIFLAVHYSCGQLIQVSHNANNNVPLVKSYGGVSSIPLTSSYLSSLLPLSYGHDLNSYGVSGLNGLNVYGLKNHGVSVLGGLNGYGLKTQGVRVLSGVNGYGLNNYGLGLNNLRTAVVAPQVLNYGLGLQKNFLSIGQRPALAQLAVAQPAVAIDQRSVIGSPQLYASEGVRPVNAAIHQIGRTVEYRAIPYSEQPIVAQEVVVEPSDQPINIHFRSRSSTVRLTQEHIAGEPGTIEQTQSQDEPSKVIHEVVKPVIQEVREVVQPYRQLTQEIQPVVENVHTVVSEGQGQRVQYVGQPQIQRVAVQQHQQIQQVRPVSVDVAQPIVSQIVAQPELEVSQPVVSQVNVEQPAYAQIALAQPQIRYQNLDVANQLQRIHGIRGIQYQNIQNGEPIRTSIVRSPQIVRIAQPIVGVNRFLSAEQPLDRQIVGVNRFSSVEQPLDRQIIGVNRFLSAEQPLNRQIVGIRQEVRELRPEIRSEVRSEERQIGNDYLKYSDSNSKDTFGQKSFYN